MLSLCPFRSFKRLDPICTALTKTAETFNIIFYSENHFCMNYPFNYFKQHASCLLDQHRTRLNLFCQQQHQVSCKVKGLKMTPCWTFFTQCLPLSCRSLVTFFLMQIQAFLHSGALSHSQPKEKEEMSITVFEWCLYLQWATNNLSLNR